MNEIYNLFKKDFLLIKKYLLTIFLFIVIAPFLTAFIINHFGDNLQLISNIQNSSILLIVGLSLLMICVSISFGIVTSNKIIKNKEY